MKKIKNVLLSAGLFITFFITNASASIIICFGAGNCYIGTGSCDGWCPDAPKSPTCSAAIIIKAKDYIQYTNRQAWVVQDGNKIPVASDKLEAFMLKTKNKYSKEKVGKGDFSVQIQKEYEEFFKIDDGIVSPKRLAILQQETSLKVIEKSNEQGGKNDKNRK